MYSTLIANRLVKGGAVSSSVDSGPDPVPGRAIGTPQTHPTPTTPCLIHLHWIDYM